MRFARAGLDRQSSHIDGGVDRFALPLVGVWGLYPDFSARSGATQTIAARINNCLQRSINGLAAASGRPGNEGGRDLYFASSDRTNRAVFRSSAAASRSLPLPERAADPAHGSMVFQTMCSVCHQSAGSGLRNSAEDAADKKRRYLFAPLWGPESFNEGAGMSHIIAAAWFIRATDAPRHKLR